MGPIDTILIALIGITAAWLYLKLKERVDFLEHEVRWLRSELESLKPTEIKSSYGRS